MILCFHICVAMKATEGNFHGNALTYGVGGLNIGGSRIGVEKTESGRKGRKNQDPLKWRLKGQMSDGYSIGRWPANVLHDGNEEAGFPFTKNGGQNETSSRTKGNNSIFKTNTPVTLFAGDSGSASRFFKEIKEYEE